MLADNHGRTTARYADEMDDLRAWWLREMIRTSGPLREVMTLFWHGHFTSSFGKVRISQSMYEQNAVFRRHALGNFRQLLNAVLHDSAMMLYLDMEEMTGERHNENLARGALRALHPRGGQLQRGGRPGDRSRPDRLDARRAGRRGQVQPAGCPPPAPGAPTRRPGRPLRPGASRWRDQDDPGRSGAFGLRDVADILVAHPATARFLAGRLIAFFRASDPHGALASAAPRSVTIENPAIMEWTGYDTELRGLQGRSASAANANDPLERIRQLGEQTVSLADRIHAAQRIASRADYPSFRLSQSLRLIGQMAVAGLPTRVFHVSITGFDTHVEQLRRHRGILQELSQAVGAFARDMQAAGQRERTLVMTVSEFGRRVAENGTLGTDHGSASAMLLAGGSVVPGLHGGIPDLSDLDDGDVRHQVDFRAVYASVLRQWFGVDPDPVLFGRFEPVALLRV